MNTYLIIILCILIGEYVLGLIVEQLNLKHLSSDLPKEFHEYYDTAKYKRSQNYLRETTSFKLIEETLGLGFILLVILLGGFNWADQLARGFHYGPYVTGLIFAGIFLLASQILGLPFSIYSTFVIEEKYGFNKTTPKTFILDMVKGLLLGGVIGVPIFLAVLWFFAVAGPWAWLYCWLGLTGIQLFLTFIAPVVILPLFNKFTPLEDGELKDKIEAYAKEQNFQLQGVFTMDGSRRSTKSNAFFTGFGRFRRIALFDTLIEKHTTDELVSVLAHEIGHYKKKHIVKGMFLSVLTTGLMFFLLSFFLHNEALFAAFKMEQTSIYASLFFFGFLYSPISMLLSIFGNVLSRKHEYEADAFAVTTYKKPKEMITALKKLSVDNLSNLTPHPLKVFLSYSHPPVLKRIEAIRK